MNIKRILGKDISYSHAIWRIDELNKRIRTWKLSQFMIDAYRRERDLYLKHYQ